MYTPDALSEWQVRIGGFIQGAYQEIITPAFDQDEQHRLADIRFDFPASAPGHEPLAFWRSANTVHLSAASMKFVADILLAYVWLGRNGYQIGSLDDYLLMLACWKQEAAPPPPRIALHIPDNAREDQATDLFATRSRGTHFSSSCCMSSATCCMAIWRLMPLIPSNRRSRPTGSRLICWGGCTRCRRGRQRCSSSSPSMKCQAVARRRTACAPYPSVQPRSAARRVARFRGQRDEIRQGHGAGYPCRIPVGCRHY